jgi:drug/metabolite transporter, DME family
VESSPVRNRLLLLGAAVLFSTGGAAIKATLLTPPQVACFRSAVAALVLVLILPEARRGWTWRVLPVSLAYACTLVLFVFATRLTTAANAIFLESTAPLYVLVLSPLLLREPLRRADLLFGAAVAAGLAMFFTGSERALATAPNPHLGNLLGAVTGLSWACTLTGLRWMGRYTREDGGLATVVAGNLIGCLATLPLAFPVHHVGAGDVLAIGYLGVFQVGLAYLLLTRAIRHVPVFEAGALLLLEPALNPVWAWLVHGERPGIWALAGGAAILLSTAAKTWWQRRTGLSHGPV